MFVVEKEKKGRVARQGVVKRYKALMQDEKYLAYAVDSLAERLVKCYYSNKDKE